MRSKTKEVYQGDEWLKAIEEDTNKYRISEKIIIAQLKTLVLEGKLSEEGRKKIAAIIQ